MVRAEADALRERAAAEERELIRCGDESDRSRLRSASRATSRQPSRDPSLRPGRMGARQREESIKEEPEEQDEPLRRGDGGSRRKRRSTARFQDSTDLYRRVMNPGRQT